MKGHKLLLAFALVTLATGCLNTRNRRVIQVRDFRTDAAEIARDMPRIDDEKLKDFFFKRAWVAEIPNEVFKHVTLQGDHVYVFTEGNRLYQVSMQSGVVNWVFDVGTPLDIPESGENPITVYEYTPKDKKDLGRYNEVFFTSQGTLFALDMDSGSELWRKRLRFPISSSPAATNTHVILGSWDNRLYGIDKKTQVQDWFYLSKGDVTTRPTAERYAIYATTKAGQAIRMDGSKGNVVWPFQAERAIRVDSHLNEPANLLYVCSDDYTMYVVNTLDGKVEWKHVAGGQFTHQPVGIGNNVYAVVESETFEQSEIKTKSKVVAYRNKGRDPKIRKNLHEVAWERENAIQFLAEGVDDVYLLEEPTKANFNMVKVDKKTGFLRDSLELKDFKFFLRNRFQPRAAKRKYVDGMVFMATRNGWLAALKETPRR